MTAKAFVLIEAEVGRGPEVVTALKKIEGVTAADLVSGPYDVIAVVEGERLDEIGDIVAGKIQPVPGVSRVVSCLVGEERMNDGTGEG